jgi:uncharacterized protein DUF4232
MIGIRPACFAALAVLAAAEGCGSSDHGGRASGAAPAPLVRWTDEPVPALAAGDAAPAAPCRASQLRPSKGGFTFQAAVAGATGSVAVRNVSKARCRLTGRPAVRFVGASKAPEQRQVPLAPQPPQFPHVRRPSSWLLSLAPGRSASLAIEWRNWCVPNARAGKTRLIAPTAVRVTLASGRGSLSIPYNAVTSCERPREPSTIGVQPFQPPLLPRSAPWTSQVLSANVLTVAGEAEPLHARRGELLAYSVAIRNPGRATVRFDKCPFAVQMLAPAGAPEAHRLNCGAARPLAPRASLRFEMRIRIPAAAPVGPNGLFWELDPLGAGGPQVVSRLIIDE